MIPEKRRTMISLNLLFQCVAWTLFKLSQNSGGSADTVCLEYQLDVGVETLMILSADLTSAGTKGPVLCNCRSTQRCSSRTLSRVPLQRMVRTDDRSLALFSFCRMCRQSAFFTVELVLGNQKRSSEMCTLKNLLVTISYSEPLLIREGLSLSCL